MFLSFYLFKIFPAAKQIPNEIISAHTTVGPTGVESSIDASIPNDEHATEMITETMTVERKLRATRIAESAGKISNAETSSEPTSR